MNKTITRLVKLIFMLFLLVFVYTLYKIIDGSAFISMSEKAPPEIAKLHKNTITLKTDGITAVVAPELSGRLIAIIPKKGKNLLWVHENPEIDLWGWKSYGGDKTWIGPQDAWNDVITSESDNWPPPPEFDGMPFQVVAEHKKPSVVAVEMLSPPILKWNLRVRRIVGLDVKYKVFVTSRLEKYDESKPVNAPEGLRFTNWAVTQVPVAPYVDVYLCGEERVSNGVHDSPSFPQTEMTTNNILRVYTGEIPNGENSAKACFDANMMSIPLEGGKLIITQNPASESHTSVPERGQLYVTGKKSLLPGVKPYMEIEWSQTWPDNEQTVIFEYIKYHKLRID